MDPRSDLSALALSALVGAAVVVRSAHAAPTVIDPNLEVVTVVSGLNQPTSMAFIGANDILVLEKATGQVKRVAGAVVTTVLDLAVNSASERGLHGIALHPDFPANPGVYLYWTESTTGADSGVTTETPLLGNRVDRFLWNGSGLTPDRNIVRLRAFQQDGAQTPRGNHNGGVIRFGPDRMLYIFIGDVGRRGQMQNLADGPFGPGQPDDQFGGPQPDDAHLSGVILRLDDQGRAPSDNPFFAHGAAVGGQVGPNIQKVFSYGHRNSFGMAFSSSGQLWLQENGDDSFSELNRVEAGMNGGWVQVMGPIDRVGQYRAIETSPLIDPCVGGVTPYFGLQQDRWDPSNIATTPEAARAALFMLPGAHYRDPELSWMFEIAPAGIGFVRGQGLGRQYDGDLFVGASRPNLAGGYLLRIQLNGSQRKVKTDDPLLKDDVADNVCKFDGTESASLLFGSNFGVGTDVQTGPNGNLFVVSLSDGAIYEVRRK